MSLQTLELTPEQQRILWACYAYWATESCPPQERQVCYTWVSRFYEERFGGEFSPRQLRNLVQLGYLRPGELVHGGGRRYYTLVDPGHVEQLLRACQLR